MNILPESFDQNKPIVFLDIDGVLNHRLYFKHADRRNEPTGDRHLSQLSEDSIEILNEIYDWNFVLSSTWRKHLTINKCQFFLKQKGFKGKLLDATPILIYPCLRGNEILKWMKDNIINSSNFNNYVIFDDDSDMLYWQRNNFFLIDGYCGITPNVIYRAKRFLAQKDR
jgi:hypothetical protein